MTEAVVSLPVDRRMDFDAVETVNREGTGPLLFICEHASNAIPAEFGTLGLSEEARISHIAWDPGARELALRLCGVFNAPLVTSRISRLVYDCNRPPESAAAMPARSEIFDIPGNCSLSSAAKARRIELVYRPFQETIREIIDTRTLRGLATVVVTVHSFTPVYEGQARDVEVGIIHDLDRRMADAMLATAPKISSRKIERNKPYDASDGVTHTLEVFGTADQRANVMIEVRNDLLTTPSDIQSVAAELNVLLTSGLRSLGLLAEEVANV